MTKLQPLCILITTALCLSLFTNVQADEKRLIGRWKMDGDTKDASGNGNHGSNHGADLTTSGQAARFDGRDDFITVNSAKLLNVGKGDFSISVRVNKAAKLDDVLGTIVSKYDPAARKGFQLSIKNHAGTTSSQSNYRHLHFGIDNGKIEREWIDHGKLGNAILVYSMAVYDGHLFAGTCVPGKDESGRLFRFDGGKKWIDCGSPDKCNAVTSLAVFQGKLYAGTGKYRLGGSALAESENPNLGGKVFRYEGDGKWKHCGTLPKVEAINGMVVFRGKLYASSMYRPAAFFRYDGGRKWTSCGTPFGKRVESLAVYNGHIYATGYDQGAVYRYDGKQWKHLGQVGKAMQTYGFTVYRGDLYVSEWPHAQVFRYGGGNNWIFAGRLGEEKESMPLVVYNGKIYGGTLPLAEVYRYDGSTDWTKVGRLDFTPDVRFRRVWSMAVYQGRLFAGTLPSGHVRSIEAGKNATYDKALPPGRRHIAAVKERNRLKLYVDGNLVATSTPFDPKQYDLSNDAPLQIDALDQVDPLALRAAGRSGVGRVSSLCRWRPSARLGGMGPYAKSQGELGHTDSLCGIANAQSRIAPSQTGCSSHDMASIKGYRPCDYPTRWTRPTGPGSRENAGDRRKGSFS